MFKFLHAADIHPFGQNTRLTSKPFQSMTFAAAIRMNLRRLLEASMRIRLVAQRPALGVLGHLLMPLPKYVK